jgi:hypothetical protein
MDCGQEVVIVGETLGRLKWLHESKSVGLYNAFEFAQREGGRVLHSHNLELS